MKMIWILLTIGLTFAENLDRTYLPPAGSSFSGGSPGAINVPLGLPKTKYSPNDERFPKIPELVIGINRVGPSPAADNSDDLLFTQNPKITYDVNSSTSQTITPSSVLKQFSPFPFSSEQDSTPLIPMVDYDSVLSSNDLENPQKIYNIEKYPRIMMLDEKNKVFLPSYRGDNTDVSFITLPPPFNNEKGNYYTSTASKFSATTPLSLIKGEPPNFYSVGSQNPERIQAQADRQAVILNYDQSITPEGYAYSYDTSNGIHGDEEGTAINGVKAKGSYSYIGDDGNFYQVEYIADENGFVPKGAHFPTAPPIPDAILKVIEQAARDKEAGVYDDGSYNEDKYGYKKYQDKYSQINNIINGGVFPPENEINIEKDDIFNEYEDSDSGKSYVNGLSDIDSIRNSKNNYQNYNNNGNNNILPSKNIVTNENYQEPLSKSDLDVSDKNNENFSPQNTIYDTTKLKTFPFRFSGIENQDFQPELKENNTEKNTAKPFLTRYVTRKGDDSETDDYDEQPGNGQQDTDFEEQTFRNRSEGSYGDSPSNFDEQQFGNTSKNQGSYEDNPKEPINKDEGIDSREFTRGDKPKQVTKFGERINNVNLIPSDEKGYFYQKVNKPFVTLDPRVSYTSSTAAPTDFSASISTQDVSQSPVRGPSSFRTPTSSYSTPLIDASTKLSLSLLLTSTLSPVTLDNESTPVYPDAYSKTYSITTPKSKPRPIGLVPGIPDDTRFGMPYRPITDSFNYYTDTDNGQTSPENSVGEDFTGPKQLQRYDPITGYYY